MPQQRPIVFALSALCAAALASAPAGAQTNGAAFGPHDPYCGAWYAGAWMSSGNCTTDKTSGAQARSKGTSLPPGATPERISGTISAIDGHLVTLQGDNRVLIIDVGPALANEQTGRMSVGQAIRTHGYWQGGTYYAERLTASS